MNEQRMLKVLLSSLISEKTTLLDKHNQYAFKVAKDATKSEIKEAVEKLFNVNVLAVQVINMKPKKVRFGKIAGKQKAWKKAYVRIASNDTISFIGAQA